jgi:PTH1 family peptidyl-tRNA hydrolase
MAHFIIVGLGNPGEEYRETRHNAGRMVLDFFHKSIGAREWQPDKKLKALLSDGKVGKNKVLFLKPETFMNKSGLSVGPLVKSKKAAESLVVIHDDLDIPFGSYKISFNKSSGGHRGVESVIKSVKTEAFVRVRLGISPQTPSGKIKKPKGEEVVGDFILGNFKPKELLELKKISKRISEVLSILIEDGREKAMSQQR